MQFKSSIHRKAVELAIGLFSVVTLTLVGCGGDNNPAPAPPSTPTLQNLLNLYPEWYMGYGATDLTMGAAAQLYDPILNGTASLAGICQTGSVTSDLAANATATVGAPIDVVYANCGTTITSVTATGTSLTMTRTINGTITYTLNSISGDYLTNRTAVNENYSATFGNGFTMSSSTAIGTAAPVVLTQGISGSVSWIFTGWNMNTWKGTQDVVANAPVTVTYNGTPTTIKLPTHSSHVHSSTQLTRNGVSTIRLGSGNYADQDIVWSNLITDVFPVSSPTATVSSGSSSMSLYNLPSSGMDKLTYGVSKIYATYNGSGVYLQFDTNGDGCIDGTATVTSAQLNALPQTPLPSSLLIPTTGSTCVAAPGSGTNSGATSGQNTAVGSFIADHLNGNFTLNGGITINAGTNAPLNVATFTAAGVNTYSRNYIFKTLANGVWSSTLRTGAAIPNMYYLGSAGWVNNDWLNNGTFVDSGDGSNATIGFTGFSIGANFAKSDLASTPISCGATACAVPGNYPMGATLYTRTSNSDLYSLYTNLPVTDASGVAMTALPGIGTTFCEPGFSLVYSAISGATAGANNYKVFTLPAGGCTGANIASAQLGVALGTVLLSNQATGNAVVPNVLRFSGATPLSLNLNDVILGLMAGNVWRGGILPAHAPGFSSTYGIRNKIAVNAELAANGLAQIP